MPKLKTRKTASKRFKRTASGKLKRHKCGRRHLLTGKSPKRRRQLRKATLVSAEDAQRIHRMMPNG